jgi:RHS repeat-associated protein
VLSPAGKFYIAPDHLDAPHQITDPSGAVVWQWNFDPFGNGAPIGSLTYDLRFPGQFFDQATKLHYNYFRDYDPRLGRYIESDPIGLAGGINSYAYVGGNPVNHTDPLGLTQGTDSFPSQVIGGFCGPGDNGDKCSQLIQQINAAVDDLKRRYYQIIEDKWNLPPTGPNSVAGHQQQFENRQDELRDLLNQAATLGCTGYDPDAWDWATRPVPSPAPK